jgi:hypothetical protein
VVAESIPAATQVDPGLVDTNTQTFGGNKTFANNVVVTGDLTVNGTNTIINTTTLDVEDKNVVINKGGTDASADVVRITLPFTSANDVHFRSAVTIGFSSGVNLGGAQENLIGTIGQSEAFWTMWIYNQFTSAMSNYQVSYLLTAGEIQFSVAYHMNI